MFLYPNKLKNWFCHRQHLDLHEHLHRPGYNLDCFDNRAPRALTSANSNSSVCLGILLFYLFFYCTSPLMADNLPWRAEPYALLLIQKAHSTKRLQDKKEYLQQINQRLHLSLPIATWTETQVDEAIRHFYALFYSKSITSSMQESLPFLTPFFGTLSDEGIVQDFKKIDQDTTWAWTELQLNAFCLDMQPLVQSLSSIEDKIESINWYLFFLGEIRYPPLKEANRQVDLYSSLGPILSSRQGICLGTTILFAAVCQRLSIPVVTFTPPGHIFAGVPINGTIRVVETTARGANIPLFQYESIDQPIPSPKSLTSLRSGYLENKAAKALMEHHYEQAKELYLESHSIDPESGVHRMLALCYLLLKQSQEATLAAKKALQEGCINDIVVLDIASFRLPQPAAVSLIDLMFDESSAHVETNCQKLLTMCNEYPDSDSIRYYSALFLKELHRIKEAKALLDKAPHAYSRSLNWWLLLSSLANEMNDRGEELRTATELLKVALKEKRTPKNLLDFCLQVLHQNPDCKELSSLIQKGITISKVDV